VRLRTARRTGIVLASVGLCTAGCAVPPCAQGQQPAEGGGCEVIPNADCPDGQVLDPDGACIDPFQEGSPPDDTERDTDPAPVGAACDWIVRLRAEADGHELGWSLLDEGGEVLRSGLPGDYADDTTYDSDPVSLFEGVEYTVRAVDAGLDGWEGAQLTVLLASDPLTVAASVQLTGGSEGLFPFHVLCPIP
jgi:hypothetical protein